MFAKPLNAICTRNCLSFSLRLRHKLPKPKNDLTVPKAATDVVKYLETTSEYKTLKDKVPKLLLRKYKKPESMYLINQKTAKLIGNIVNKHLHKDSVVVEVNPGLGLLTQELLHSPIKKLYLYEASNHFAQSVSEIKNNFPDRISYKMGDFLGMWKLAFHDKLDQGHRVKELLGDLSTDDDDRLVNIVGAMPSISFVKHLIYNIVFHNTTDKLGRPDLFITMPANQFEFLTDKEFQLSRHKSLPALFQLLFDYKVLSSVPSVHFLPWLTPSASKKGSMLDEYQLYLVNITRKETLPCPQEYLPLLWYFFKPHVFSKTTRIIPVLEQWIPGCGLWLITGQDPPESKADVAPGDIDVPLPHMTIFTEFGDLNLGQKMTVFKKFVSWPGFEQCQFRTTMENNLPKIISKTDDDDKDTIVTHIDELEHSDSETDMM